MYNVATYYLATHPKSKNVFMTRTYGSTTSARCCMDEFLEREGLCREYSLLSQALDPDLLLNTNEGKDYWDKLISAAGWFPVINVTHRLRV